MAQQIFYITGFWLNQLKAIQCIGEIVQQAQRELAAGFFVVLVDQAA